MFVCISDRNCVLSVEVTIGIGSRRKTADWDWHFLYIHRPVQAKMCLRYNATNLRKFVLNVSFCTA